MTQWCKSSRSQGSDHCVEVRFDGGRVLIRDSKYLRNSANDPAAQPIISLSPAEWATFRSAATHQGLRPADAQPVIENLPAGGVSLHQDGTTLTYTAAEWTAFVAGIRDGEFDQRLYA